MFAEKTMEAGASSGTATLTLGTAVAGWKTWRSQKADTTVCFYYAEISDGSIWECGYGALTYGSPDTITGRVLILSSIGALVDFAGASVYVMSIPTAAAFDHLNAGGGAAARPGWLPTGGLWRDDSAGLGTRAVDYLKTGTAATANAERGRLDGATGIYVGSNAAPIRDTTTSGSTIGANDRGYIVSHDTSAAVRVAVLPAAATAGAGTHQPGGAGFYLGIYADGIFPVFLDTNGSEAIDNAVVPPGQVVWVRSTGTKWLTQGNANQALIGRRQTVTAGPLSAGAPNLLATVSGLVLSTSNVAAATPLIVRASNGDFERWGLSTGNVSFGTLANTTTNYLYVTVGVDGVLTGGNTTLAPIYQESGTPAVTAGQFTFNIGEMKGYLGNGSTAPAVYLVMIGEAVTSGGNVTAVTAYAYNGRYDSGWTATIPATNTVFSKNHNIGVQPEERRFVIENTTTDGGYAVGDRLDGTNLSLYDTVTTIRPVGIYADRKVVGINTISTATGWDATPKASGNATTLTRANWKYKFTTERGW